MRPTGSPPVEHNGGRRSHGLRMRGPARGARRRRVPVPVCRRDPAHVQGLEIQRQRDSVLREAASRRNLEIDTALSEAHDHSLIGLMGTRSPRWAADGCGLGAPADPGSISPGPATSRRRALLVHATGPLGSAILRSLSEANCFIVLRMSPRSAPRAKFCGLVWRRQPSWPPASTVGFPVTNRRVVRGGSWRNHQDNARVAYQKHIRSRQP
ncbi:MAG: hypothetical protein ACREWE_03005 [Gammaproteobacteria bacterium]